MSTRSVFSGGSRLPLPAEFDGNQARGKLPSPRVSSAIKHMSDLENRGTTATAKVYGHQRANCLVQLSLVAACLVFSVGCGQLIPNTQPFGAVKGAWSSRSANGLAVFREMWETTGAKVVYPQKLSPRLDEVEVIVLVGQTFSPPGSSAREWLEDWLAEKPGRTVLYFGRDFNAYAYYLERELASLPEEERVDAEFTLARTKAVELNSRLQSIPESTFCGWFYLRADAFSKEYVTFTGPWSSDLQNAAGTWPVGIALLPPESKWRSRKPSWLTRPAGPNALQPANPPAVKTNQQVVRRSQWQPDELDTDTKWNLAFQNLPEFQTLLAGSDGRPLIFRLSDQQRFPDSQILIVNNGAPLLNASLVDPLHRQIAERMIGASSPASRVAFLAYGENGLLITRAPEKDPRGVGLEFLTVWPMSAITMPVALFCILLCVYLWPILGRARSVTKRSVTDFGLHIEALGRMLTDTGDVNFARKAIAEYFSRVRREAAPDWLAQLPADKHPAREAPPTGAKEVPTAGTQKTASTTQSDQANLEPTQQSRGEPSASNGP